MLEIRPFHPDDEAAVVALWQRCGLTRPWNDPHKDIQRKLRVQPELFLVGTEDGLIVASAMAGYDGHRGSIYYFGVDPTRRRRGHARELLAAIETRLRALGCPKINLQVRSDNDAALAFYHAVGFRPDAVTSHGKRLEADT